MWYCERGRGGGAGQRMEGRRGRGAASRGLVTWQLALAARGMCAAALLTQKVPSGWFCGMRKE
jgi:hypothetical protein